MQSETIGKLAESLAKAQGEIKSAVKGKENPFFKSSYADLPAIMEACREPLSKNGIAVIQSVDFMDRSAENLPLLSFIETKLLHSSGEWLSGRYLVRPEKENPQGVGSAITYARRYALAAMIGVVAENEDDDAEGAMGRDNPPKQVERSTPKPPSEDAAKKAAIAFAQKAGKELSDITVREQLTAWLSVNQAKVDKLKSYDEELFTVVSADIVEAKTRAK